MRKPIIAGNWKMNKTADQAAQLIQELAALQGAPNCDVVVCPPYVCIAAVKQAIEAYGLKAELGAENLYFEEKGAYTGEIAADMLCSVGVKYVIIGHSERRQYFNETDESVNKKVKVALAHGLIPIVCVGETLAQREFGVTGELVALQTKIALNGLTAEQVAGLVIAYEPVWAIGTGKTATKQDANEVIGLIRAAVRGVFGDMAADAVRIQYGGSMNAANAKELVAMPEIDGGLIGSASLQAKDFTTIIESC